MAISYGCMLVAITCMLIPYVHVVHSIEYYTMYIIIPQSACCSAISTQSVSNSFYDTLLWLIPRLS